VVHAKAAGAYGEFEVTHDISHLTSAKFLNGVGKTTPLLQRISTVGPEKGSADTARDPRGWAIKFYTEEGNCDWVFNNTVSKSPHCLSLPEICATEYTFQIEVTDYNRNGSQSSSSATPSNFPP